MNAYWYMKQSAEKLQRFKNGSIKLELCRDGVVIRGIKELPANEGMLTYCDRVLAWILLENSTINPLDIDIALVVDSLELEVDDADR